MLRASIAVQRASFFIENNGVIFNKVVRECPDAWRNYGIQVAEREGLPERRSDESSCESAGFAYAGQAGG